MIICATIGSREAQPVEKLNSTKLMSAKPAFVPQMGGLHDAKGPRNLADDAECSFQLVHRQRAAGYASNLGHATFLVDYSFLLLIYPRERTFSIVVGIRQASTSKCKPLPSGGRLT